MLQFQVPKLRIRMYCPQTERRLNILFAWGLTQITDLREVNEGLCLRLWSKIRISKIMPWVFISVHCPWICWDPFLSHLIKWHYTCSCQLTCICSGSGAAVCSWGIPIWCKYIFMSHSGYFLSPIRLMGTFYKVVFLEELTGIICSISIKKNEVQLVSAE